MAMFNGHVLKIFSKAWWSLAALVKATKMIHNFSKSVASHLFMIMGYHHINVNIDQLILIYLYLISMTSISIVVRSNR